MANIKHKNITEDDWHSQNTLTDGEVSATTVEVDTGIPGEVKVVSAASDALIVTDTAVVPGVDSTSSCGSASKAWADVHTDQMTLGASTPVTSISNDITSDPNDSHASLVSAEAAYDRITTVDTSLTAHTGVDTGVHGVGAGDVVGTTLTQILTNKTLTAPIFNAMTLNGAISGDAIDSSSLSNDSDAVAASSVITSAISTAQTAAETQIKVGSAAYSHGASTSGTETVSGLGFTPKVVICIYSQSAGNHSIGFSDGTNNFNMSSGGASATQEGTKAGYSVNASGIVDSITLSGFTSGQFTVNWATSGGSSTNPTLYYLAIG